MVCLPKNELLVTSRFQCSLSLHGQCPPSPIQPQRDSACRHSRPLPFNSTSSAKMASSTYDLSEFLNPPLCANADHNTDGEISPCEQPATMVCSGCYLVQVRFFCSRAVETRTYILTQPSTALKPVKKPTGNSTRRHAKASISKKLGGRASSLSSVSRPS